MKSIIVSVIVVCLLIKVSFAQYLQEIVQPGLTPENCYYIDTYKTDFGPSDELVRSERSFLKKLFKNWGKRLSDCVPCCQNNAEYSASPVPDGNADYNANGNYDNNNNYQENDLYNEPAYSPPDIAPGRHGMIYLPLPHPHRIMTHLHGYFNRSFRRGGPTNLYSGYPPQDAYGEQKSSVAPVKEANAPAYEAPAPAYEESAPAYEAPAAVEEVQPTYPEKTEYSSVEVVKPTISEKQDDSGSAESSEEKKSDYKEIKKNENSYVAVQPQVTPQIVQSIVPILVPPVYIYTPQYYSPPAMYGQSLVYQSPAPAYSQPSSFYSAAAPSTYSAPAPYVRALANSPPASSYSPAAPSYSPPATSYSPLVTSYSPPATSYSPPATSYSPPVTSYSPPATSYSPPATSYSPPAPSYSPPATDTSSSPYSPPTESYTPPSSSYSAPPSPPLSQYSMPYSSLDIYSSLLNPLDYSPSPNYFKRTYSTSLTYLLPPTSHCSNAPSYSYYDSDQPIRSCPELFTSYGDDLGSSHPY